MQSITQTLAVENEISSIIESFFRTFKLGTLLRRSGAYKKKGVPALDIFRKLFELAFIHKNLCEVLRAEGAVSTAKDTFYRFLNSVNINWTRFTLFLAERVVNDKIVPLTDEKRVNVFIVDDTVYERNRSKNVELLSRVYDHSKKVFIRGFRLLTLGWSDGNTFVPAGSCLLASADGDKRFQEARSVDKRSCGYRRRQLSQGTAPAAMMELVRRALAAGLKASYVLFDSWFSTPANILALKELKLDVIAMVKKTSKVHYHYKGRMLPVTKIYAQEPKRRGRSRYLLSVEAELQSLPVRLVFVRNRRKRKEYLVLLSTDRSLSEEEVVRLYGKRWSIEVFFKTCKSLLRLTRECQSISYDAMSAWVSVAFARYVMLAYLNRLDVDERTAGELFYSVCDELADITLLEAFELLMRVWVAYVSERLCLSEEDLSAMLEVFMTSLPLSLRKRLKLAA